MKWKLVQESLFTSCNEAVLLQHGIVLLTELVVLVAEDHFIEPVVLGPYFYICLRLIRILSIIFILLVMMLTCLLHSQDLPEWNVEKVTDVIWLLRQNRL